MYTVREGRDRDMKEGGEGGKVRGGVERNERRERGYGEAEGVIGVEEGVMAGKREWEGEGTDRVSSNGAEPPKQMKLKLNNNYVNIHGWRIIDQLHTRAKEFNWRDVTSGCSFAATLSIAVNGEICRWAVEMRA